MATPEQCMGVTHCPATHIRGVYNADRVVLLYLLLKKTVYKWT